MDDEEPGLVASSRARVDELLALSAPDLEVHVLVGGTEAVVGGVVLADAAVVLEAPVPPGLVALTLSDAGWCSDTPQAAARRTQLARVLAAAAVPLVCLSRDVEALVALTPALAPFVAAVPTASADGMPFLDLAADLRARPNPDPLTPLLLPLAATLGDRVVVHGARLHDVADPADAATYCNRVLWSVRWLEEHAIAVRSATDTDLPALRRRQVPSVGGPELAPVDLALLAPDYESGFGHYGAYAHAAARTAREQGLTASVLAARSLVGGGPDVEPFFTYGTLPLRAYAVQSTTWRRELRTALASRVAPGGTAYLDCASFAHVDAASDVAVELPDRRVVVNVMNGHDTVADAGGRTLEARAIRVALTAILDRAATAGVVVTVDTDALGRDVLALTGHALPTLPMATVLTFPTVDRPPTSGKPLVLFPGKVRVGKGLYLLEALVQPLLDGPVPCRVALRPDEPPGGRARAVEEVFARLEQAGVELLDSRVDDDAFVAQLREADVVVLPYEPTEFRTRTSGLVVDALLAGTPVVTSTGTWGAGVVEREGGLSGDYHDPEHFVGAIRASVDRSAELRAALVASHRRLADEFALSRRVAFVLDVPAPSAPTGDALDRGAVLAALLGASAVRAGAGPTAPIAALERTRDHLTEVVADLRSRLRDQTARRKDLEARLAAETKQLRQTERELAAARRPLPVRAAARIKRTLRRPPGPTPS